MLPNIVLFNIANIAHLRLATITRGDHFYDTFLFILVSRSTKVFLASYTFIVNIHRHINVMLTLNSLKTVQFSQSQ